MGWNFFTSSGEIKRVSKSASTVSETAPPNPANGDLWTNASNMVTYVYYSDGSSSQWVEAANNARPTTMYGTVANRPAASTTGLYYYATNTKQVFIDSGSAWVEVTKPTYETSLPTSPYDGQTIIYPADTTNGIMWTFRYRAASSSSYKWEFIGGSPLADEVTTQHGTTSTTYTTLTSAGPSITVPLAGDYDVTITFAGTAGASNVCYMSYDIGATGAVDADAAYLQETTGGGGDTTIRGRRKTFTSASTALVSKYKSTSSGATAVFRDRRMIVAPVRVG